MITEISTPRTWQMKSTKKTGNAIYLSTFEEIEEYLLKNIQDGDIVVTMGAGNVYLIGESILSQKKQEMNEKAAV